MGAPLSVIVPTLGVAERIGPCLGALAEGLTEGLIAELILADGGSADGIAGVAEAVGARLVRAPRGRGPQLAAGARAARGEWLLFLHADTVLSPGWAAAAQAHMRDRPDRAGWFALRFDATGPMPQLVAGWANLRSALFGLPFGDQGLLISRAVYCAAGGHPEIPLMEDVALARQLGRRRLARIDAEAITSAARYRRGGWLRRGWLHLSNQALYFAGVPPERLARRYGRG